MELQHVNAKIHLDGDLTVEPARFIEIFHTWIQQKTLGELLIDVADYRHVPAGPGIVLMALEADYSMDHSDGLWGLRYNRKARLEGSNAMRLAQALHSAVSACRRLEAAFAESEALRFSRRRFELLVNDRALAPNTPQTYAACRPEFQAFLEQALGHAGFSLTPHNADPRVRFGWTVQSTRPFELEALIETLSSLGPN